MASSSESEMTSSSDALSASPASSALAPLTTPPSTPPVLKLPPELMELISFACASGHDLKNLSLAIRDFRPSAQKALFHTFHLGLNLTSFANLILVSQHNILQTYVRVIEYSGPDEGRSVSIDAPRVVTFTDWLRVHPAHYRELFRPQWQNIQAFDVIRTQTDYVKEGYFWTYNRPYGQEYLQLGDCAKDLLLPALKQLPRLTSFRCDWQNDRLELDRILWTFLGDNDLLNTLRDLKELHIGDQLPADIFSRLPMLRHVFSCLTSLRHLSLGFGRGNWMRRVTPEFANTGKVLSDLTLLRSLEISHDNINGDDDWGVHFNLSNFFSPRQHWQHLQHLELDGILADYQKFMAVLTTHASSLRSLNLSHLCLTSDFKNPNKLSSWVDFFVFLHEHMSLTSFDVDGDLETIADADVTNHATLLIPASPQRGEWFFFKTLAQCNPGSSEDASTKHINCLKYKIQLYVIHEGPTPFIVRGPEDDNFPGYKVAPDEIYPGGYTSNTDTCATWAYIHDGGPKPSWRLA